MTVLTIFIGVVAVLQIFTLGLLMVRARVFGIRDALAHVEFDPFWILILLILAIAAARS